MTLRHEKIQHLPAGAGEEEEKEDQRSSGLMSHWLLVVWGSVVVYFYQPEFFWLVTGLPSVGMECWKMCTVSWTVCRCRHTSSGSMQVETFWASR